ncbi:MAG TPA: phosphate ABC transporter permease subunit PstC [Acidimicrobiales bacterium]|nr:phosphate ABC transporter permease subunit PstC [Acidimicrobiales bacterium]
MSTITLADLRGNPRRLRKEAAIRWILFGAAAFSVVVSGLIVLSLVRETWTFVSQVEWSTVWSDGWFPRRGLYDIKTLIVGSLIVTVIAMGVAVPTGLGTAIYLSEYAKPRTRRILKPALETLAAVPSVVIGFFALTFIAPEVVQRMFSGAPQQTLLAAGIGVGILLIPVIASVTEDAMRAVPSSLREASYGIGAKKVTTVVRVVFPAALSGVVASLIIAVSRALGETMVVFIAAGKSGGSLFETNPLEPGLTMTAGMASIAAGTDNVVGAALTFQSLFFVGMVLFVITLALNLLAGRFVRRFRQRY